MPALRNLPSQILSYLRVDFDPIISMASDARCEYVHLKL